MGKFALEAAEHVSVTTKYFSIKYPYGKLICIGCRNFSAGAMENLAHHIREVILLIDEKQGLSGSKKEIASVIAHEMAHQCSATLVTMSGGTTFVNEGFANVDVEQADRGNGNRKWNFKLDDVNQNGDTLNTLRPTRVRLTRLRNARRRLGNCRRHRLNGKLQAVLRCWSLTWAREFPCGCQRITSSSINMQTQRADFWDTQTRTSKKPVDQIMPTFVIGGRSIIDVKLQCSGNSTTVKLNQRRYYYDRQKFQAANDELWPSSAVPEVVGSCG